MCLEEYIGRPQCERAADSGEIFLSEYAIETVQFTLGEDGEVDRNAEPHYAEDHHYEQGQYHCECGWEGGTLSENLSREDCECSECVEPDFYEGGHEPDEECIVRVNTFPSEPLPYELERMRNDRALWYCVVPRWRAYELEREFPCVNAEYQVDRPLAGVARFIPYPSFDDREVCA